MTKFANSIEFNDRGQPSSIRKSSTPNSLSAQPWVISNGLTLESFRASFSGSRSASKSSLGTAEEQAT